jgi:hypothetical protein
MSMTGANRASDSSIEALMFFRLNDSDAALNTATSRTPACDCALHATLVRDQDWVTHTIAFLDAGEDLLRRPPAAGPTLD